MSTVYVVQQHRRYDKTTGEYEPVHDLTPAEEYGEIKFLLTPTAGPWEPRTIAKELIDGLGGIADGDYLMMIGNPVLCSWAAIAAAECAWANGGKELKFLQWSGKDRSYTPVSLPLEHILVFFEE